MTAPVEVQAVQLHEHETLDAALAAFQRELPAIGRTNRAEAADGYTYRYADLADISLIVLPQLAEHGLSWSTTPTIQDGHFVLLYSLVHDLSGDAIEGIWPLPVSSSQQEIGSAITYARRYTLCAVTGVAPGGEDNDAAAVSAPSEVRDSSLPYAQPPQLWALELSTISDAVRLQAMWQRANDEGWLSPSVKSAMTDRRKIITGQVNDA